MAPNHEMWSENKFELAFKDFFSLEEVNGGSNYSDEVQSSDAKWRSMVFLTSF
jgi:hypothetical protein